MGDLPCRLIDAASERHHDLLKVAALMITYIRLCFYRKFYGKVLLYWDTLTLKFDVRGDGYYDLGYCKFSYWKQWNELLWVRSETFIKFVDFSASRMNTAV